MLGFCVKEFVFYFKCNRKLLYGFKQSNNVIRFVFQKDYFGLLRGNQEGVGLDVGGFFGEDRGQSQGVLVGWREVMVLKMVILDFCLMCCQMIQKDMEIFGI